jgi:hypothetical protein
MFLRSNGKVIIKIKETEFLILIKVFANDWECFWETAYQINPLYQNELLSNRQELFRKL